MLWYDALRGSIEGCGAWVTCKIRDVFFYNLLEGLDGLEGGCFHFGICVLEFA